MVKGYLFVNGASEVGIDYENNKYYVNADIIHNDNYDYFMEVSKEKFKEILKIKFNWILSGWDEKLKTEYINLLKGVE